MQGQYKVPGGKLVVATFDVSLQRLCDVHISGDFFLEPDSALTSINLALESLDINTPPEIMAGLIQDALPAGAVMFGFDPASIVEAIRRGLEQDALS